ncbi:MAG: protein kinase family protein, partial [Rhodospirillaceae bacterium]
MTMPLISDYKAAVANAKVRFATLNVLPELDSRRHPVFMAGNFACVFKVREAGGVFLAVKCFTRDMPDLERRYRALARYIKTARSPYMVDIDYLPRELYTSSAVALSDDYPVLLMPWLQGSTIGGAVETLCQRDKRGALAA